MTPLLAIRDLEVRLSAGERHVPVVRGLSLTVERGEIVGLVGESGCGKSLTALAVLGLLPSTIERSAGSVQLDGTELGELHERELRTVRGRQIGVVFQEPAVALNPVLTVGQQVVEAALADRSMTSRQARERAVALLERCAVDEPERRMSAYPHELSGGQKQRVMIAIALAASPCLLIADEPTTSLDVTVQAEVLTLISELRRERRLGVLWITHDLAVVASLCDRIVVMYAGAVVESGSCEEILRSPRHPYTAALLKTADLAIDAARSDRLATIPGSVPVPGEVPPGCAFHPRCPSALPVCSSERPSWIGGASAGSGVECWLASAAESSE